jgi:hypothetical protein
LRSAQCAPRPTIWNALFTIQAMRATAEQISAQLRSQQPAR